jgi:hypothetical protein
MSLHIEMSNYYPDCPKEANLCEVKVDSQTLVGCPFHQFTDSGHWTVM